MLKHGFVAFSQVYLSWKNSGASLFLGEVSLDNTLGDQDASAYIVKSID